MKTLISLLLAFVSVGVIKCWPDFFLYNKSINGQNLMNISLASEKTTETKFIVHGFMSNGTDSVLFKVKDALVSQTNAIVIIVDWSVGAAGPNYFKAVENTKVVGKYIADFIQKNRMDATKIHLIGHSLGAHVCGFAGKLTKQLKRISGLDPAGPSFEGEAANKRLDKNDALLVDCIHTSSPWGNQDPVCFKDFYVNSGQNQPGCPSLIGDGGICNHLRAVDLFAESVSSKCLFTSIQCESYEKFNRNDCVCDFQHACSPMGYFADTNMQSGRFYLNTNSNSPYCLN